MSGTLKPLYTWRSAITDSNLPADTRHVALTLSLHMSERGDSCYPSLETLRQETGRSKTTISAALKRLAAEGWLEVRKGGGRGNPNRYSASTPSRHGNGTEETVQRQDRLGPETVQSDPINGTAVVPEDVSLRGPRTKNSEPPAPEVANPFSQRELFGVLCEVEGFSAQTPLPRAEHSRIGKVASSLRIAGATPDEIRARAAKHRTKWPGVDVTANSLETHWSSLNGGRFDPDRAAKMARVHEIIEEGRRIERERSISG